MADIEESATPNEEATEKETDFDAELEAEYDRIQSGEEPKGSPEPDEKTEDSQETTATKTEDKGEPEQSEEAQDDTEKPAEGEPATDSTEPPDSWSAEAKEKFKAADPIVQAQVLKREQDFINGFEKYKESAQVADRFEKTMAPYQAMIQSEGSDSITAVQNLMNMAYVMRQGTQQQKTDILLNAARDFKVDLGQVTQNSEDTYTDPDIQVLKGEIAELKNQQTTQHNRNLEVERQSGLNYIDEFKGRQDDKGNPAHPHFEEVRVSMGALINSGQAKTMEDAYEQAIWANPGVRDKILLARTQASEKESLEDAKQKAADAKKTAGTQVATTGTGNVEPAPKSWDEDLSDAYDRTMAS